MSTLQCVFCTCSLFFGGNGWQIWGNGLVGFGRHSPIVSILLLVYQNTCYTVVVSQLYNCQYFSFLLHFVSIQCVDFFVVLVSLKGQSDEN
jgi:hypothetical protein